MASVSYSTIINKPVDKVFGYVTNVENHTAWQAGIQGAQLTPAGPVALGSVYHYTVEVMGRKIESQMEVSAFEPNQKWSVKTMGTPRPVETVYLFENMGDTTKLTISMDLTGGYPAAAEAMVKQQMEKSLTDQGNTIKTFAER